jgi:cell division protein FtsQ
VSVVQRTPIVRVINADGSGFYIDEEGWTMPTELAHPARVPVVTGALAEPGARNGVMDILNNDSLRSRFLSDDIHRIATFLRSEPFWEALVDQLVVRSDGLFELIPKVGGQRILIGDGTDLEQRFAKLRLFYAKGMPMTDWRRYELIDLRFADQVVCTQRTTP